MFTEDYVLRQISLLVAVLMKVTGLAKGGEYQDAHQVIDQTIEEVFGLDAEIVKQLDEPGLTSLLTSAYGIDLGKYYLLAGLLDAEGDVLASQHREKESRQDYQRALDLYLKLSANPPADLEQEIQLKILEIQKKLDLQD